LDPKIKTKLRPKSRVFLDFIGLRAMWGARREIFDFKSLQYLYRNEKKLIKWNSCSSMMGRTERIRVEWEQGNLN
jgi:hypothetical protein